MSNVQHTSPEIIRLIDRELKRKTRREKMGGLAERQIAWFLVNFIAAWMFMLAVAVAHAHWMPALPTIGYWWSLLLTYLLRGAFVPLTSKNGTGS